VNIAVTRRIVAVEGRGTLAVGAVLAATTVLAWVLLLRNASSMSMPAPGAFPAFVEAAAFTAQWGIMMAAMMLPSAAPMILLYRTVSQRLSTGGARAIPTAAFAGVYLLLWLACGVPVYGAYIAVGALAARWQAFDAAAPYAVAAVLAAAGVYQLTEAKRVCLRHCESPLGFLMPRWRSGYAATLSLAAKHACYCIGCCWSLMAILVAAGAMSMPWVLAITLIVFTEKLLPQGQRTARLVGVGLILLGLGVALRPDLARTMRGSKAHMAGHTMIGVRAAGDCAWTKHCCLAPRSSSPPLSPSSPRLPAPRAAKS
jgi:predicted metal-binding membrane protein